jgi:DNA-binding response OmpR family regulator
MNTDTQKTILVVEDERPLSDAIKAKLEKSGFAVVTARTVDQTLSYLEDIGTVDAVWLDHYLLGKEDGLDFVTKIKVPNGRWNHLPIFVVSNTASPDKVQSYIRLGINKYYTKSDHRLDEIISDIKSFVENPAENMQ